MIPKEIFNFLVELSLNNNRVWFNDNKGKYLLAKDAFDEYVEKMIDTLHDIDPSIGRPQAKDCVFRIYRDVRFGKNKQPFKNNFGAYIAHGGRKSPYAGYYFQIEPDNSFIGGGIYTPEAPVLKSVREYIIENPQKYKALISDKDFIKYFKEIHGEQLKTAPKGFDKADPNIDLIKHKSYSAITAIADEEIISNHIDSKIADIFTSLKPFNQFINNGVKRSLD